MPLEAVAFATLPPAGADAAGSSTAGHDAAHAMPCCDDGDCMHCDEADMQSGSCARACAASVPTAIASTRQSLAPATGTLTAWPPLALRPSPAHSLRLDRPPAA